MSKQLATVSSLPDVTLCAKNAHITPSNSTDIKFLKNNNSSDRMFTADIDHLNESLYKINKFMQLTKDIDDLKRKQSVGHDIQRKLSLKEQWLKNTPSPSPSVFSRGSSMYGSTQSVNSLTSLNSHGSGAAKPAASSHVKPLENVTEFKSPVQLKPEVKSKLISQSKIVVPSSSSDVKTTTEAELFGTLDSSTVNLQKSPVEDDDDDDLSYLDALELNDAEIRELTQPLRENSSIDYYHKKKKKEIDLKQALKKIELKNFADTFSHIQSQFTGPKVSTDTARDLSKFFPKKEEPVTTGGVNKNQKELKDVDLAKYFAPSPVQQRKTIGFDKEMASKVTKRPIGELAKTRSTSGAKEKEFNMFDSQLDGAIDLKRPMKSQRVLEKKLKPKSSISVKPKPSAVKPSQYKETKMSACNNISKCDVSEEIDDTLFDKLFEVKSSSLSPARNRNESETSSTSFDHMFKNDDLESSEIEQGFEQVAQSSGIKYKSKSLNVKPKPNPPPLKTRPFDSKSLEKYFTSTSDTTNLTYHRPPPTWCKKPSASKWEELESRMISAMPLSLQAQIRELEQQIAVDEPLSILEDFDFNSNSFGHVIGSAIQDNAKVPTRKGTVALSKSKTKVKNDEHKDVPNKKIVAKKKTNGIRKAVGTSAATKINRISNDHYTTMDEIEEQALMELSSPKVVLTESKSIFSDMPHEGVLHPKETQSQLNQEVQLNDVPHEGFMLSIANNENMSNKMVPVKPLRLSKLSNTTDHSSVKPMRMESNHIIELYHNSKVMNTSSSESHGSSVIGTNATDKTTSTPETVTPVKKLVFKYKPLSSVGRDIIDYPLFPEPLKIASPERAEISVVEPVTHDPVIVSKNMTESQNVEQSNEVKKFGSKYNSRESSPLTVARPPVLVDDPVRPNRRQRIETEATDRLLERSQAIHNRKQDFMNEKMSRSNPYLRRAQDNQSKESLLSTDCSELGAAKPCTMTKDLGEYRRSDVVPRFNSENIYSMPSTNYSNPRNSINSLKRLSLTNTESTFRDYRSEDYRNPMVDRIARANPSAYSNISSGVTPMHIGANTTTASSATPTSRFSIFKRSPVATRKNSRNGKKDGCIIG